MTAKRMALLLVACVPMLAVLLSGCSAAKPGWKLAWEENFSTDRLDDRVWSKIMRAITPAFKYMSPDERCYDLRDGLLVLRGIVNDDREADTAAYLTGGVRTRDKHCFEPGRIEVRARLHGARGAWPAIWTGPFDRTPWPHGGEIDIMEHLNYDSVVYQTAHSHYTVDLGFRKTPPQHATARIDPDGFNVYGVDIWPDSLVFHVNGVRNFVYPKIETEHEGQFPFYRGQYLMIDMQLGGNWVGPVNPDDLPVEMEIDWVRHYVWKQKGK